MRVVAIGLGETLVESYVIYDATEGKYVPLYEVHAGATADIPTYADVPIGTVFHDTTLGKMSVAGAADWELVTSA